MYANILSRSHYVMRFTGAVRMGLDPAHLLRAAHLESLPIQNLELRVTSEQLGLLARQIWIDSDNELMGCTSSSLRYGVFGLFAKYSVYCHTLRGVYRHLCQFYNLVTDSFQLSLQESGSQAMLTMTMTDSSLDEDHAVCEFLMLMWHRFPSWLIGRLIPLDKIAFEFSEPAHVAEYKLMYNCPTVFEAASNSLSFPREMLDIDIVQTEKHLIPYLRRIPFDWFNRQIYYPVYSSEVLKLITSGLNMSMEEVADRLNVTTRTLRRKLTKEGTSFQMLKDNGRRDAAIHLLTQPELTLEAVSDRLGFSDPAAFSRAFKTWDRGATQSLIKINFYPE
jgi:AraC-type DNA-binding domain-containing proteins